MPSSSADDIPNINGAAEWRALGTWLGGDPWLIELRATPTAFQRIVRLAEVAGTSEDDITAQVVFGMLVQCARAKPLELGDLFGVQGVWRGAYPITMALTVKKRRDGSVLVRLVTPEELEKALQAAEERGYKREAARADA